MSSTNLVLIGLLFLLTNYGTITLTQLLLLLALLSTEINPCYNQSTTQSTTTTTTTTT